MPRWSLSGQFQCELCAYALQCSLRGWRVLWTPSRAWQGTPGAKRCGGQTARPGRGRKGEGAGGTGTRASTPQPGGGLRAPCTTTPSQAPVAWCAPRSPPASTVLAQVPNSQLRHQGRTDVPKSSSWHQRVTSGLDMYPAPRWGAYELPPEPW